MTTNAAKSIEEFLNQVQQVADRGIYFAALSSALIIPDICGSIEYPDEGNKKRFENWFEKYAAPKYIHDIPAIGKTMLFSWKDCYAYRCAMIHEGSANLASHPRANSQYDSIAFYEPTSKPFISHMNVSERNGKRYLMIDIAEFCSEMVDAGLQWLREASHDPDFDSKAVHFMKIHDPGTHPLHGFTNLPTNIIA